MNEAPLLAHCTSPGDAECGAVGGIIGRGNRNNWRKPASVSLCSPQIPHDLTLAAVAGSHRELCCSPQKHLVCRDLYLQITFFVIGLFNNVIR
jgi:hypothetical protein